MMAQGPETDERSRRRRTVHVPMAFAVQGSTLLTVVRQLAVRQSASGEIPLAALSDNRSLTAPEAEAIYVDHTRYCPRQQFSKYQLAVDVAAGAMGFRRPFYGRLHQPTVEAVRSEGLQAVLLYEGHYAAASLPWWNTLRPEIKVILYVHNPLSRTYLRPELRRLAAMCDAMVFCADHLRAAAAERLGQTDTPLLVVHNGVDASFLEASPRPQRPDPDSYDFLFLGRVTPEKGVHVMIQAMGEVQRRTRKQLRAVVVGSANYSAGELTEYEEGLRRLAADDQVDALFIPHVERGSVRAYMASAFAVCIPSLWVEGLPLVALESMATGTPIVTLDSPGVAEACGPSAFYALGRNPSALADAMIDMITDVPAAEARGRIGLERAATFTWERSWQQLSDLLDEVGAVPKA